MVITRVGPVSFAKVSAAIYAIFGLIFGCVFSLAALAGAFASDSAEDAGLGAILGMGAVIVFPIFYGVAGFVGTLFAAWLYNLVAGVLGGVEVDIQ